MIKIIESGQKKYRKRCCYCGCLFAFEEEDISHNEFKDDHGISWGGEDVIECPFCQNKLHVDKTDVHIGPKEEVENDIRN